MVVLQMLLKLIESVEPLFKIACSKKMCIKKVAFLYCRRGCAGEYLPAEDTNTDGSLGALMKIIGGKGFEGQTMVRKGCTSPSLRPYVAGPDVFSKTFWLLIAPGAERASVGLWRSMRTAEGLLPLRDGLRVFDQCFIGGVVASLGRICHLDEGRYLLEINRMQRERWEGILFYHQSAYEN